MKRIFSICLTMMMVISLVCPLQQVEAKQNLNGNRVVVENVKGISYSTSDSCVDVENDGDFNSTLDSVSLIFDGKKLVIQTVLEGDENSFSVDLYQSQIGYNAENTVYGIEQSNDGNYRLLKLTIEKDTKEFSLLKPNWYMEGETVVTLAFGNKYNNRIYYYQFACNNISVPVTTENLSDMMLYEMANYAAKPYENVEQEFNSLELTASDSMVMDNTNLGDTSFLMMQESNQSEIDKNSRASMVLDSYIEECKNGPISMQRVSRTLVPDIPDSVYKKTTSGWEKKNNAYVSEGSNASRACGYVIYHMPDSFGNALNYALRYEAVANYNYQSQRFISSFKVTHNLWVEYNKSSNTQYIFDQRPSNARITITASPYVKTTTQNGYFTHYQNSSISTGSQAAKILSVTLKRVKYLGAAVEVAETISSGTKVKTGTLTPTDQYTKLVETKMNKLIMPKDHVTVEGVGSGVKAIAYGYTYTCDTK